MTTSSITVRLEDGTVSLGSGVASPRVSWIVDLSVATSTERRPFKSAVQTGYEIEATLAFGDGPLSTGFIPSDQTQLIDWPFAPLTSRQRVSVRVRSWLDGHPLPWSDWTHHETGLLTSSDWTSAFISPSVKRHNDQAGPAYALRAEFDVNKYGGNPLVEARLYATAHGVFDAFLNQTPVSDELLSPGWTSYSHRLRVTTTDVGHLIKDGRNSIGVLLADGWWRGRLGFNGGLIDNYGPDIAILAQLELRRADGTFEVVDLDEYWRTAPSTITSTGLYEGEHNDARLDVDGWLGTGFDDSEWQRPQTLALDATQIPEFVAPTGPPVRVTETIEPVVVERRTNGRIRLDFGQNISGRLRIRASAAAGHRLRIHHAEVLEDDELATRPLRGATSIDSYTFRGAESEEWAPRFTFHGFRYAELEDWPGDENPSETAGTLEILAPGAVVAEVLHSDMRRTGHFSSSNPMLNQLHANVVWSMRDNFVDLPTDCPQRDERLGWTGDIQVFGPTAAYLFDSGPTLRSWMQDVAAEQKATGSVPNFVPWIECGFPSAPAAAWGDVAAILPWTLYQSTGDKRYLRDQFESMCAWVDQVDALSGGSGLWNEGFQLGDWLDPAAPPERPDESRTDRYLVATAYHVHSAGITAKAAAVLGDTERALAYGALHDRAIAAFRAEYLSPNGRVVSDTETALSLALVFDLFETSEQAVRAGQRLVSLVEESGYLIRTGFIGTPIICDALALVGAHDTAYHLLGQTALPSWLYPITMGATTVWERWDSMLPDGSINPGEMTSFNHYSLGAVADFLHTTIGGIRSVSEGYRVVEVAPKPGGGLNHAETSIETRFGRLISSWTRDGEIFRLRTEVPFGVTGTVILPDGKSFAISHGSHDHSTLWRSASQDPAPRQRINLHNPEERAA